MITFEPSTLDPRTRKHVMKDGKRIGTIWRERTGMYAGNQIWEFTDDDGRTRFSAKTLRQIQQRVREEA